MRRLSFRATARCMPFAVVKAVLGGVPVRLSYPASDMPMRLCTSPSGRKRIGPAVQRFDNPALGSEAIAPAAQIGQIGEQPLEFRQSRADMANVLIKSNVRCPAIRFPAQSQAQQCSNLFERHVHRPAQANEAQLADVLAGVLVMRVIDDNFKAIVQLLSTAWLFLGLAILLIGRVPVPLPSSKHPDVPGAMRLLWWAFSWPWYCTRK